MTIFLCPRCRAILSDVRNEPDQTFTCTVCRAQFEPDSTSSYCPTQPVGQRGCHEIQAYLREWWSTAEIPDVSAQQTRLARAAAMATGKDNSGTPLTGLFSALASAKGFVHFTSWGISQVILGGLKLLSEQNVYVAGIVSSPYSGTLEEIKKSDQELESLFLNVVGIPQERSSWAPHQKIVVIDGLLAFKGSANLSTTAWRKARKQQEFIEVVTSPAEVMRLNNIYFSRSWLQWGRNRFKTVKDINRMDHM
jgi:hypothetical protein